MIQKNAVYRKSSAGQEALARRDPALTLRLRSLLILVDGKRTVEELARLSAAQTEIDSLMTQLLDLGMAEPVTATAGASAAPAPALAPVAAAPAGPAAAAVPGAPAAAPAPAAPPLPLEEARRVAVRRLSDLLGPTADDMCMRIEAARTPQEFLAAVKRAEGTLRGMRGAQHADGFLQALAGYRAA